MPQVTFEQLLKSGAHFGHLTRKWNPKMAPYIFMEKNGIHIIDLQKTLVKLDHACRAAQQIAKSGRRILFVGTKKQAKEVLDERLKGGIMPYVTERWPGGMLTNFPTIRKAVKKMTNIDKMISDGTFDNLSKRERLQVTRQRSKLEKNLGSIADMNKLPAALFVVDVMKECNAVREANRLGIPVFAIVDTCCDPTNIDFVIPANDDSSETIDLIVTSILAAIDEGIQERKQDRMSAAMEEEEGDVDESQGSRSDDDEDDESSPRGRRDRDRDESRRRTPISRGPRRRTDNRGSSKEADESGDDE